ncbi:MAG TPA: ribonuclease domain-containing protein [Lysobacter sp.]|nr:ribonuclease domain-containing protein [Lysobacter sp.]
MRAKLPLLPLLLLLLAVAVLLTQWAPVGPGAGPGELPPEAVETLRLIEVGGPFPHRQDGTVFQNRELLLPGRPPGYYREYTVRTPGVRDRGARRIVTGGEPPEVFYYTEDHYRSFREIAGQQ